MVDNTAISNLLRYPKNRNFYREIGTIDVFLSLYKNSI